MRTKLIGPVLLESELEMVNKQKLISKENLTKKELCLIKKKIYASIPDGWGVNVSKSSSRLVVDIIPSENYLNFSKIILDGIERVNSGPLICGCDELETFRGEIKSFLSQFNTLEHEEDSDLPSLKRFYYLVILIFKDQSFASIKKITKELHSINQLQNTTGFLIADFNKYANHYGLDVQL